MTSNHSLKDLKHFHNEAMQFFAAELMMMKEVVPKIKNDRIGKCTPLLISCGQTGAALLQLASQTDSFSRESVMLARAFMEKITNFCYAAVCDEKEFRAFILHPVYKNYHNIGEIRMEDSIEEDSIKENSRIRKEKQEKLKEKPIVKEALTIFSESNPRMNWTKKTLAQRIEVIQKWGKFLDVFFTLNKIRYYSDASEVLHGSLYGCIYNLGLFDADFDLAGDDLDKKAYKDSTCMLLHLGQLIHESFTLIKYTDDIEEIWNHSYDNRAVSLNLLFHVLERKIPKR